MAKKAAPKKSAAKKSATKKSAKGTRTKKAGAKKGAKKKAGGAKKKASGIRLNEKQAALLGKVGGAGETGYHAAKGEAATLTALQGRKLLKRGKKDKASGKTPFHITKAGQKHITTSGGTSGSSPLGGSSLGGF